MKIIDVVVAMIIVGLLFTIVGIVTTFDSFRVVQDIGFMLATMGIASFYVRHVRRDWNKNLTKNSVDKS